MIYEDSQRIEIAGKSICFDRRASYATIAIPQAEREDKELFFKINMENFLNYLKSQAPHNAREKAQQLLDQNALYLIHQPQNFIGAFMYKELNDPHRSVIYQTMKRNLQAVEKTVNVLEQILS